MKRGFKLFLFLIILSIYGASLVRAQVKVSDSVSSSSVADVSTEYIIIKLQDPPAASYEGGIKGMGRTKPLKGKFDPSSGPARAYLRYLQKAHGQYRNWLSKNAKNARVAREYRVTFNGFAIKLNGESPSKVASGPGTKSWSYSIMYHPALNVSTHLIGADVVWGASRGDAGKGVAVAIIDSGIQDGHPFFACKGQNGIPPIQHHGPYFSGETPSGPNNPFPTIVDTHGTHVAGIVGGCVCELESCDPDGGRVHGAISGVAPAATLHDFNVFPGVGAGFKNPKMPGGAFDHDIAAALEDAVLAGVDVINMSLGGELKGPNSFIDQASDAAVDAGVVVVAAGGNSGPGDLTAESPGTAAKVIAAGASSNPHFIGIPVTIGGTTYGAVVGEFNNFTPLTAEYTVTDPADGCDAFTADLTRKIALIDRGICTFGTKILNAENAGAVGALIVNNRAGDPVQMALDSSLPTPSIPAAMLSKAAGNAIKPNGTATVDGTLQEFISTNADILADFSSMGPAPFTYLIKPDVCAPGVNVYSSTFSFGAGGFNDIIYDFEMFDGTSMSTPHTSGAAALLRAAHPDWSPADVRSALVNTAARTVTDTFTGTTDPGVLSRGGGRIDVAAANVVPLTFDPASVSFGFWSGNKTVAGAVVVTVHNVSGSAQSCTATITGPAIASVSPAMLVVPAGGTSSLTITLDASKASQTSSGDYDGDIVVTCGATELKAPWFVRVDRNGKH